MKTAVANTMESSTPAGDVPHTVAPVSGNVAADPPEPPDEILVGCVRQGDRDAAEELVKRYQQRIYGMALHMNGGDAEAAKDLVQETFLRCFKNIHRFRGESSFYTWLYRIAVNLVTDERRRRIRWRRVFFPFRREREDGFDPDGPEQRADDNPLNDPAAVLREKDLRSDVRRAMANLPEQQRLVFRLKVFEGMTLAQIAKVMNLAEGTVKSHFFRAGKAMRVALADWSRE